MKKSTLVAELLKKLDKPKLSKAASKELLSFFTDPLKFKHEPVYKWLLINHAEVERLRDPRRGVLWKGIAQILAEDGVIGSRGAPPNANSVRRVWKRVCRDKLDREAEEAKKAEGNAQQTGQPKNPPPVRPAVSLVRQAPMTFGPIKTAAALETERREREAEEKEPYDPDKQLAHLLQVVRQRG